MKDHLKKKGTKDHRFCASVLLTEQLVDDKSKASIKMGFKKGNKNIKNVMWRGLIRQEERFLVFLTFFPLFKGRCEFANHYLRPSALLCFLAINSPPNSCRDFPVFGYI